MCLALKWVLWRQLEGTEARGKGFFKNYMVWWNFQLLIFYNKTINWPLYEYSREYCTFQS